MHAETRKLTDCVACCACLVLTSPTSLGKHWQAGISLVPLAVSHPGFWCEEEHKEALSATMHRH
jgi:hypothetical protein